MKAKLSLLFLITVYFSYAQLRDTYSDTWTATDALGRKISSFKQDGPPKNRTVAMFYFLWHDYQPKTGPHDITKILKADPKAYLNKESPLWGPMHAFHHWGEPLFGYYLGDDEWVLRKHAQMLTDAGVDVIIFDASNKQVYQPIYTALLKTFSKIKNEGGKVPQVAFLCPFGNDKSTARLLYDSLYSKNLYSDLWFRWKGRPLILMENSTVDIEMVNFFTFRFPYPGYFDGPWKRDQWSWLEIYPQHMYKNREGENEQMSVGVGQNAVAGRLGSMSEKGSFGRSYTYNKNIKKAADSTNYGYNVAEQWEHAIKNDPQLIFVTGWNEWIALRFDEFNKIEEPVMFVDQYDQEHSRDIEPMKGGHSDNYYYQFVDYVRKYKGVRPSPVYKETKTIDIKGDLKQWDSVKALFLDDSNDVTHRSHKGYAGHTTYTNTTGRNDFTKIKVAHDDQDIYFYVETAKSITPYTGKDWMTLFINSDGNNTTGWNGYDFAINRTVKDGTTQLEKSVKDWNWKAVSGLPLVLKDNHMILAIPRNKIGLDGKPVKFEFKFADNFKTEGSTDGFMLNGDAAPNSRFNYLYSSVEE